MSTAYEKAVAEAKLLAKRSEADQWRLAELTWEWCPETQTGGHPIQEGVERHTLTAWAQDIGVAMATASVYRRIWLLRLGGFTGSYAEASQVVQPSVASVKEVEKAIKSNPAKYRAVVDKAVQAAQAAQAAAPAAPDADDEDDDLPNLHEVQQMDLDSHRRMPGLMFVEFEAMLSHARKDIKSLNRYGSVPFQPEHQKVLLEEIADLEKQVTILSDTIAARPSFKVVGGSR